MHLSIKYIGICLFFLIFGLTLGYFLEPILNKVDEPPSASDVRLKENYQFINPLLECAPDLKKSTQVKYLENKLKDYVAQQLGKKEASHISVYYRDLNNGPTIGINEKEPFVPASLVKLPLMIAYFKISEEMPGILNTKVKIPKTETNLQQNYEPNIPTIMDREYTLFELIERMIEYSDNVPFDFLASHIDPQKYIKIYNDFGISNIGTDKGENILTVKDYSAFFRILYNSSYLNEEQSEQALGILTKTTFKDGLVAGVPEGTIIAHKFGERGYQNSAEKQLHDCGIVYHQNGPYLLCVMTRGTDFQKLSSTIKEVSNEVYSFISLK